MALRPKHILFICGIFAGIFVNLSTAFASSPEKIVVEFSKAYFMLNPVMENFLSDEGKVNDDDRRVVELYFEQIEKQARNQGYKPSYFQMSLGKIKTQVLSSDDKVAKVRITGVKKRSINPLYEVVGNLFSIQDGHKLDRIVTVVNENGAWKIAPGTYELPR